MDLSEIISVSGQSGLYKVVAKTKNGLIVESLSDNKRIPVYASQKVSALEEISIFLHSGDTPLSNVFKKIYEKENKGPAIDAKSDPEALKKYFSEILPDYDEAKVYTSDIKKVLSWYNMLQGLNMLKLKEEKKKEEEEETGEKVKESKPKGKSKPVAKTNTPVPKASAKGFGKTQTVRKTGA